MSKHTHTLGLTPAKVIRDEAQAQCPDGFTMTIRSRARWEMLAEAWNQGIDSHLEALTERSTADAATGRVCIHPDELPTLCRRLWESYEGSGGEMALDFRASILAALDIEEV